MFFIGIDGGGTKSEYVLMDNQNQIINSALSQATNINSHGYDFVKTSLKEGLDALLKPFHIDIKETTICLASAGIDQESDKKSYLEILTSLGCEQFDVMNDSEGALLAGTGGEDGIIVISGTGSIVMGKSEHQTVRAGGWGHMIGDEGSGYYIATEGIKKILQHYDGYGEKTNLTHKFLNHIHETSPEKFIDFIYKQNFSKDKIAKLSQLVDEAANEGDCVAKNILDESAQALSLQVRGVYNRLFAKQTSVTVVLNGSVIQKSELFFKYFIHHLSDLMPLKYVFLDKSAAVGAAHLAKRMAIL